MRRGEREVRRGRMGAEERGARGESAGGLKSRQQTSAKGSTDEVMKKGQQKHA